MGLDDIDEDDAPAPPVVVAGGSAATNSVFDAFDDFTGGTKTSVVIHNAAPAQPAPPADDLDFFLSGPAPSATPAAASTATPAAQAARGQPHQPKANDDLLDIFSNINISQSTAGSGSHPPPNVVGQKQGGGMFGDMSKMLDGMTSSMKLGQMGLDSTGNKGPSLKEMRTFKTDDKGPTYASNTNGFFDLMNYYELVGVARNANFDQIRAAYKAKSLKLHPDRNPNQHPDDAELYKRVTDAYDVISDEVKRREYDQFLMGGPPMGGPGGPGGPGPMGASSPPGPMGGGFPGFP